MMVSCNPKRKLVVKALLDRWHVGGYDLQTDEHVPMDKIGMIGDLESQQHKLSQMSLDWAIFLHRESLDRTD